MATRISNRVKGSTSFVRANSNLWPSGRSQFLFHPCLLLLVMTYRMYNNNNKCFSWGGGQFSPHVYKTHEEVNGSIKGFKKWVRLYRHYIVKRDTKSCTATPVLAVLAQIVLSKETALTLNIKVLSLSTRES